MPLLPQVSKCLPRRLRIFSEGLRYPHVFLASMLAFVIALLCARFIPYPEEVLIVLGITMFVSSKIR